MDESQKPQDDDQLNQQNEEVEEQTSVGNDQETQNDSSNEIPDQPVQSEPETGSVAEAGVAAQRVLESQPEAEDDNKSRSKLLLIILISLGVILVAVSGIVILLTLRGSGDDPQTPAGYISIEETDAIGTNNEVSVPEGEDIEFVKPVPFELAVTWQDPIKVGLQGLITNEYQYDENKENDTDYGENARSVQYFQAGTFTGGKVIYLEDYSSGLGSRSFVFLVRDGQQKAEMLLRYSEPFQKPGVSEALRLEWMSLNPNKVTINNDGVIIGTTAPEELLIQGQRFGIATFKPRVEVTEVETLGSIKLYDGFKREGAVVQTIPEGTLYELVNQKDGYKLTLFELELPNRFRVSYQLYGEISNARIQPIVWNDGTRNTDSYSNFGFGCGGGSYALIAELTTSDLVQIGKSDGGKPIYMFKDMNQKVAVQILSEVNGRKGEWLDTYNDPDAKPFTADEFQQDRAVIIVQDAMDRFVVMKNNANFIEGGCAKPVIYMYPESPTVVDVRVGADVVISEPFYEVGGWRNVTALPSGQLLYRGLPFDSLFWEGYGHGEYPDKSGQGVVVPSEDVVSTMYKHLEQQGFNQKESNDFVEFWSKNLPSGKYVRITWLSTVEMNKLAPLYLSVQPDTLIRTFVELEGMDEPTQLTPQKFSAPARRGFVVTEWGGLAVNGLEALKY